MCSAAASRCEKNFAAEILPIGIFEPACNEFLVGKVVRVLEILKANHEWRRQCRCAVVFAIERGISVVESIPVDHKSARIKSG